MELPVLVLPQPSGFRASTGAPFDLTADGPTADSAVSALHAAVVAKVQTGQIRTITLTADRAAEAARRLGENPLFEDWVRAVEEFRREHNSVPDAD